MITISVAKLLDGGEEGRDWRALGSLLGYKEVTSSFNDDGDDINHGEDGEHLHLIGNNSF